MNIKIPLYFLLSMILSIAAYAGGTDTKSYTGSKTVSLNGLYFGGSDGIANSFSNPAGLIMIPRSSFELSVSDILAQSTFENQDRGLYNSIKEDELNIHGGFIWNVNENFVTSVSYQQVLNYDVTWAYANYYVKDSLSALMVFDFFNETDVDAISVSAAYRIGNFTFGVTPVIYHITQKTAFPQDNPQWNLETDAAYQFNYERDAWTFGFVLGTLYTFSPELSFGLSAKSEYSASLKGSAVSDLFAVTQGTTDVTELNSQFEMPWIIGAGMVYSPEPEISFNFDFQYSLWSNIKTSAENIFSNSVWQEGLTGIDETSGISGGSFILNYKNTFDAGAGFEYRPNNSVSYRAGYRFSQSPNSPETYNLLFPSVDEHVFSIGAGLTDGNLKLDAVLLYSFGLTSTISDNPVRFLNGSYTSDLIMPMVTLKYIFP